MIMSRNSKQTTEVQKLKKAIRKKNAELREIARKREETRRVMLDLG